MEEACCALCPALRLGTCLPKTLERCGRSTANIVPGSFPGIAHIYIKKGGAGNGGWAASELIPFTCLEIVTSCSSKSEHGMHFQGRKTLECFAYLQL